MNAETSVNFLLQSHHNKRWNMNVNTNLIIFLFAAVKLDLIIIIIIFPIVRFELYYAKRMFPPRSTCVCARETFRICIYKNEIIIIIVWIRWYGDLMLMSRMVVRTGNRKLEEAKTPISIWTNILTSNRKKNTVIFFILRRMYSTRPFGMRWCVRVRSTYTRVRSRNICN